MPEKIDKEYKEKAIELIKTAMDNELLFLQSYHEFLLHRLENSESEEELQRIFKIWKNSRS